MTLLEELKDELKDHFAVKEPGYYRLKNLSDEWPAYTFYSEGEYGVSIHYPNKMDVAEHFAGSSLHSRMRILTDNEERFLELTSENDQLRNEFASLCLEFIDPGDKGVKRRKIINDPFGWWKKWCELLGNAAVKKQVYSVIAEMYVLLRIYKSDHSAVWAAAEHTGTQDIETGTGSTEVKSTLKKYDTSVTISSQNQLKSDAGRRLWLYFCRLEKSLHGVSINDLEDELVREGYDRHQIEKELFHIGYERGSSARNEKYRITETRKYDVDEKFPVITAQSFKNNTLPAHIRHIVYEVDLDGLSYQSVGPDMEIITPE